MALKIVVTLAACALPVLACAQIYTWKDASGRTHYSDQPPVGTAAKTVHGGAPLTSYATPEAPASGSKAAPSGKASAPAASGSAPAASGSAPAAAASGPQSWEDKDKDFKKRQAEKAEADAKAKKAAQEKADKDRYCAQMRNQLATMQAGGRFTQPTNSGEKQYMSDNQVSAEMDRLRSQIAQNCK